MKPILIAIICISFAGLGYSEAKREDRLKVPVVYAWPDNDVAWCSSDGAHWFKGRYNGDGTVTCWAVADKWRDVTTSGVEK